MSISATLWPWQQQLRQSLPAVQPTSHAFDADSAAVLVLLRRQEQPALLLTERAPHLRHHPGQVSFVGGRMEVGDPNLLATARREAHEEIGLSWPNFQPLGQLQPQRSLHGLQVHAFVGQYDSFAPRLNSEEVSAIFEVPLAQLHPQHLSHWDEIATPKGRLYLPHYQFGRFAIWGLSVMFIVELLQHLQLAQINCQQRPANGAEIRVLAPRMPFS